MHISSFKECISVKEALELISRNHTQTYRWYPVDNGLCKFELGGNNKEIKIYVPEVSNGELVSYPNQFTHSRYDVTFYKDYPSDTILATGNGYNKLENCNTLKKFINMINGDLTRLQVEYYEVPVTSFVTRMKLVNS